RVAFNKFMHFLAQQSYALPDPSVAVGEGYRSCYADKDFTCLLLGDEWYWLNVVAKKFGMPDTIPVSERAPEEKYGYHPDLLPYRAAFARLGFDLHLVAVQVWIYFTQGVQSVALQQAAAILAARQPGNPFFLRLHFGVQGDLVEEQIVRTIQ